MISLILTMILLVFFISNSEFISNSRQETLSKQVMQETIYGSYYDELKSSDNTVVIYPIFTQSAYDWNGIHDLYTGRCGTCLIAPIHSFYDKKYSSSGNGYSVLEFLGYEVIDDIDLDQDPEILKKYDKVILLHNEFVTRNEFDAITSHPKVIYLYPNALISEVKTDYKSGTITLMKGPGFPEKERLNGFDWKSDNTEYFDDWECKNWRFYEIENGYMLNCYPDKYILQNSIELLKTIKNF